MTQRRHKAWISAGSPARRVVTFQYLAAPMPASHRLRAARPWRRAMSVVAELSLIKTRRVWSGAGRQRMKTAASRPRTSAAASGPKSAFVTLFMGGPFRSGRLADARPQAQSTFVTRQQGSSGVRAGSQGTPVSLTKAWPNEHSYEAEGLVSSCTVTLPTSARSTWTKPGSLAHG